MTAFVEIIHSHNDKPIKNIQVTLRYQDGAQVSQQTDEQGLASFDRYGLVSIIVKNQTYQSQIELEENETITIAIDRTGLPKLKRSRKIGLRTVNTNPVLPANQTVSRQAILRVEAPRTKPQANRPPFNISLVLDFSHTMLGSKIDLVTETVVHLLNEVKKKDRISIVTFHEQIDVRLPSRKLTPEARTQLIEQLRNLSDFASSANLSDGWRVGVQQVLDHKTDDSLNWVLLFTDGLTDRGITDEDGLVDLARQFQQQGVNSYTFGVGADCRQTLLKKMAELGDGKFYLIEQTEKIPAYLHRWFSKVEPKIRVGHNVTIDITMPDQVQVSLLQAMPHQKIGTIFRIQLGEMFTRQKHLLPLTLQFPPYPVGKQICLNVKLYYHDPQKNMTPVTVMAFPLCFVVVDQPSDRRPDPPPVIPPLPPTQLSPATSSPPATSHPLPPATELADATVLSAATASPTSPVAALLSGGILFVMGAIIIIGSLLMVPTDNEPQRVVVVGDTASQAVVVATETAEPIIEDTPIPKPTETSKLVRKQNITDTLKLPTATPTETPKPTATPIIEPTETNTPSTTAPQSAPAQPVTAVEGLAIGNLAPDFTLGSHLSERVSLSGLRGKGVILNFWTTWCPYCAYEVPDLESIHNQYGPQGIVVLAINQGESLETVEKFAWDHGIHFNVWMDEDKWAGHIYAVRSIPTTYFIDKDGLIRYVHVGQISHQQIVAQLDKILPNKN